MHILIALLFCTSIFSASPEEVTAAICGTMHAIITGSIVNSGQEDECDSLWNELSTTVESQVIEASNTSRHKEVFSGGFATWHLLDQGLIYRPQTYHKGVHILCTRLQQTNLMTPTDIAAILFQINYGREEKDYMFFISARYLLDASPDSSQQGDTLYFELGLRANNGRKLSHKIPVQQKHDDVSLSLTMKNTPTFTETAHYTLTANKTPLINIAIDFSMDEDQCVISLSGGTQSCKYSLQDLGTPRFYGIAPVLAYQGRYASWFPCDMPHNPAECLEKLQTFMTGWKMAYPVFAYTLEITEALFSGGVKRNIACVFFGTNHQTTWLQAGIVETQQHATQDKACAQVNQPYLKLTFIIQDGATFSEKGSRIVPLSLMKNPSFGFHISLQDFCKKECAAFPLPNIPGHINCIFTKNGFSVTEQKDGHTNLLLSTRAEYQLTPKP